MGAYFDGMLRYFELSGRSTRTQYWMFYLIQLLMLAAGIIVDYKMGGAISTRMNRMPVTLFMMFIHLVPASTVQVRRLHDIGRSGGWYLLNFVPFGGLVLLYWACLGSDQSNRYDVMTPASAALPQSSIPRGVRMGNTLVAGRTGPSPTEGRFI